MKHRPLSRRRINDLVIHEVQRERLARIARGEIEPMCDREGFFLWSVREGGRPKYADFILPPLLYLYEQERLEHEARKEEADAPADVTAS
ncbi:hypothetical protein [uncultured Brevundimonas sp.]|uniref:hypothetical protein n=1 Tax=uncultured Brevundimonas sp. TaxID=213418 RepID=UPI00260FEA13|nr:hypothetical protein [uncultured Brevundimonas sp.]